MDPQDRRPLDLLLTGATLVHTGPELQVVEDAVLGIRGERIVSMHARDRAAPLPDARRHLDRKSVV